MRRSVTDIDLFRARVDGWVRAALRRHPSSFGALLRALPGVDPALVVRCLEQVAEQPGSLLPVRAQAAMLLGQALTPQPTNSPSPKPVPHPLDCYWPNDQLTLRALTGLLARITQPGHTIAYLGWPNAFADARPRLRDRTHMLLERDPRRAAHHRDPCQPGQEGLTIDVLHDELPSLDAHAIIADPPWYPKELMAFLWAAARLARAGAQILLAMPPIGTRPGIELERRDVLDWAASCGLRPRDLHSGALGYLTPPFERSALEAQGVPGTPRSWRRGDLMIFQATPAILPPRPAIERDSWHEYCLGELPIRVRIDDDLDLDRPLTAASILEPIVDGNVLPTVSRRAALRGRARLWTSRNRVFGSLNGRSLAAILDALPHGLPIEQVVVDALGRRLDASEQEAVRRVARRLRMLVALERREHGLC